MLKDCGLMWWVAATLCATTLGCHSENAMEDLAGEDAATTDLAVEDGGTTDLAGQDIAVAANFVLGQPDVSTNQNVKFGVSDPYQLSSAGGKLLVADSDNNRILIWNSIPSAPGTA